MRPAIVAVLVAGCTSGPATPVAVDPGEAGGGGTPAGIPDVRCAADPDAGPAGSFNHVSSELVSALGSPKHRGIDVMVDAAALTQTIAGAASYTAADKALEDEDVDLFACRDSVWQKLGTARTDGEGNFTLELDGNARLPIGMRDMFVSVVGDRTGARFLAYVAPAMTKLIVSDVDGTLTSSENAFFATIVTGDEPGDQPGAPDAFAAAVARGYQPVYLTARGQQYTSETRQWLADEGFPRGPLRLAASFVTLPGGDTVDFKVQAMQGITDAGFAIEAGVGNRDSDVTAYTDAGVAPERIFIKLPEYQSEVQPDLDAHRAIGFLTYDDLRTQQIAQLP
jgi:phosphatidate phosphatase PAH1